MTLKDFAELAVAQGKMLAQQNLNIVPIVLPKNEGASYQSHPTGTKAYVYATWMSGFWYRLVPGTPTGQIWPRQFIGDFADLQVHKDAFKELGVKRPRRTHGQSSTDRKGRKAGKTPKSSAT